jgi:hypothetical protein
MQRSYRRVILEALAVQIFLHAFALKPPSFHKSLFSIVTRALERVERLGLRAPVQANERA